MVRSLALNHPANHAWGVANHIGLSYTYNVVNQLTAISDADDGNFSCTQFRYRLGIIPVDSLRLRLNIITPHRLSPSPKLPATPTTTQFSSREKLCFKLAGTPSKCLHKTETHKRRSNGGHLPTRQVKVTLAFSGKEKLCFEVPGEPLRPWPKWQQA